MTTVVRRGLGAVLTALGLALSTTGLMTMVSPELGPQPRAVAPIDLQDPAGPEALPSPPDATSTPDGPAVVAGPDTPPPTTDDPVVEQAPPAPSNDAVAASGAQDEVGAVAIEVPEPLPAGGTRTTAGLPAEDPVPTTDDTVDPDAHAPAPTEPEGSDEPGEPVQDDPNAIATRDDQDDQDDGGDEGDDDEDDRPRTRARATDAGGATQPRVTAGAPDADLDRGGKGPAVDVPGLARGLADTVQNREDRPGRGHGTPWVMRGR